MTTVLDYKFNLENVHSSWRQHLEESLELLDSSYIDSLNNSNLWLPGPDKIFNAFSLPMQNVNYILIGESPYPRKESANGYAFWDEAVKDIWSSSGMSTKVNRATSLRNIIKMLLVTEGLIDENNTTQEAIASVDKSALVSTNAALFNNFLRTGFLLLNATPVLQTQSPHKDANAWRLYTQAILSNLLQKRSHVKILLLGNIANRIDTFISHIPNEQKVYSEHPYNHTFIKNKAIQNFFHPLHLLLKR